MWVSLEACYTQGNNRVGMESMYLRIGITVNSLSCVDYTRIFQKLSKIGSFHLLQVRGDVPTFLWHTTYQYTMVASNFAVI